MTYFTVSSSAARRALEFLDGDYVVSPPGGCGVPSRVRHRLLAVALRRATSEQFSSSMALGLARLARWSFEVRAIDPDRFAALKRSLRRLLTDRFIVSDTRRRIQEPPRHVVATLVEFAKSAASTVNETFSVIVPEDTWHKRSYTYRPPKKAKPERKRLNAWVLPRSSFQRTADARSERLRGDRMERLMKGDSK